MAEFGYGGLRVTDVTDNNPKMNGAKLTVRRELGLILCFAEQTLNIEFKLHLHVSLF